MTDPIVVPRKRCSKCGREFPLTAAYFTRYKSTSDGFSTKCRACGWKWSPGEFQQEILKTLLLDRGYKLCRDCGEVKLLEDFRLHSSGVGGRRPECTLCWREDKREYSARDDIREYVYHYRRRDDIKAQRRARESTPRYKALKRAYDQRPDRKELRNERNASPQRRAVRQAYNQRHEVKERNKKRSSLYGGLYRKKRIKKNGLPSSVWRKILAYFDGCCAVCGKSPDEFTLIVVDHWNPISKGGEHVLTNIVPLCHCRKGGKGGCNRYKWNKDPYQWLTEEFGQAQAHEIEKRIQLYFEWIKENFL